MEQKKILIADDNENIREALTYLLEDEGYKLWLAKDGADTLRKVTEVHPDILFLDIMMPEINGYDVCRTIKNDPNLKLYPREGLNVFYVGMNNKFPPFDNAKVRQAVAVEIPVPGRVGPEHR